MMPEYLLLLYEGAGYRDDRPVNEIVGEYRRWADSLRAADALTSAGKLSDERLALRAASSERPEPATTTDPTGYFIIRARQAGDAEAIARTAPHLKYGGLVVLRPVQ